MKILVNDTDNLQPDIIELARILERLRHYTKIWQTHYGYPNKKNMKFWEEKADEWISNHLSPADKIEIVDAKNKVSV